MEASARGARMIVGYPLLYRLGITPWEQRPMPPLFRSVAEAPADGAPRRGLDVGCGSGSDAVYLAQRGWRVTAVDAVESALARARERAAAAGVEIEFVC